ncbi:MAG: polysaccharide biosynthesis protein [Candidatus Paceibacterota bacterium]|jgi:FlaA1/EpsC-like NDP-sugar epimerase
MSIFKNSVVLITGGTGSWGNELTRQLLEKKPKKIIIYSRSELQQVNMQRSFNNSKIKYIIGDIRDYKHLVKTSVGVDYIFHLAALKHVPICEEQQEEAVKTNIIGTQNVIDAAKENKVKKVIDVSTDKAADPFNFYGMTKAVGERLMINANIDSPKTKFVCIRGGNVLGTNGSIVPFFIDQINRLKTILITDREMTRYYITLKEAIHLLFKATENSFGGETFVMKMPACKVIDIAEVLIKEVANQKIPIKEIGVRPGEKIHECLIGKNEAPSTYQYDKNYYVILPQVKIDGLEKKYKHLKKVPFKEYSSNDILMNKKEIKEMLKNGNFI